ncbi:MAG: hypothetical protein HY335_05740 [Deinococcus sp.]|nr:hypothetical protein [Deinococcus sp.]
MKLGRTGFTLVLLAIGWALAQPAPREAGQTPAAQVASVQLQNGDRVSGQVMDPTISLESLFGTLPLPYHLIRFAAQQGNMTVLSLQSGDRVTGTLTGPGLNLLTAVADTPLSIAWSFISILSFPAVDTPPGPDQVVLVNHDWLSGVIETEALNVQTSFGMAQIDLGQIRNITRTTSDQDFIFALRDGDRITGSLPEQTLRLQVAEGEVLELTVRGENLLAIFFTGR